MGRHQALGCVDSPVKASHHLTEQPHRRPEVSPELLRVQQLGQTLGASVLAVKATALLWDVLGGQRQLGLLTPGRSRLSVGQSLLVLE